MESTIEKAEKALRKAEMWLIQRQFARAMVGHRMVFLGDSITHNLGSAPHFHNFGATGAGSDYFVDRMHMFMPQVQKASAVSLLIGTNDIWQGYDSGLGSRLSVIAMLLPEDVPLIWSTIPPQRDSARPREVNQFVKALAALRMNTQVIDTWELFTQGSAQAVVPEYFLEDRVHLSPAGYRKWIGAILQAMPPLRP